MHSQGVKALGSSVILSGPGNVRLSRFRKNHLTTIQWQVRFLYQIYKRTDILRTLIISFQRYLIYIR